MPLGFARETLNPVAERSRSAVNSVAPRPCSGNGIYIPLVRFAYEPPSKGELGMDLTTEYTEDTEIFFDFNHEKHELHEKSGL